MKRLSAITIIIMLALSGLQASTANHECISIIEDTLNINTPNPNTLGDDPAGETEKITIPTTPIGPDVPADTTEWKYPLDPDPLLGDGEEYIPIDTDNKYKIGTPNGNFDVSSLGAAVYSLSIDCPSGGSLTPQIGVTYNSQAGYGIAGYGCNLSGISVITLGGSNLFYDGVLKGTTYTAGDNLFIDGKRLILQSGTAFCEGAVYTPEGDPYTKVTVHGTYNDYTATAWFEVKTTSGITYYYGATADSRLSYSNKSGKRHIAAWYISRTEDRYSNYITYSYEISNLNIRPSHIIYGKNKIKDRGITNTIDFAYKSLSEGGMPFMIEDVRGMSDVILESITTGTDGNTFRVYKFTYDDSSDQSKTKYPRLTEICEENGSGDRMAPIRLSWKFLQGINVSSSSLDVQTKDERAYVEEKERTFMAADLTGDGISDIIRISPVKVTDYSAAGTTNWHEQTYVYISRSRVGSNDAVTYDTPLVYNIAPSFSIDDLQSVIGGSSVMDFDGDGYNDLIIPIYNKVGNSIYETFYIIFGRDIVNGREGAALCFNSTLSSSDENPIFTTFDTDGNGKDDVLYVEKKQKDGYYPGSIVYMKEGTKLECVNLRIQLPAVPEKIFTADFNNDGLADIILFYKDGYTIYYNNGGTSPEQCFNESNKKTGTGFGDSWRMQQGDFDGDGLTDFVYNVSDESWLRIARNNGDGTFTFGRSDDLELNDQTTSKDNNEYTIIVWDMDNDGKSDVFVSKAKYVHHGGFTSRNDYDYTRMKWLYSDGTALKVFRELDKRCEEAAKTINFMLGDFNGDGAMEMANYGTVLTSTSEAIDEKIHIYKTVNNMAQDGKVRRITDGLGHYVNINYKSATMPSVYIPSSDSHYPINSYTLPVAVVSNTSISAGAAGTQYFKYRYGGLKLHIAGKGMLGFTDFTKECTTTGIEETYSVTEWDEKHMIPVVVRSVTKNEGESSTAISRTTVADLNGTNNYFAYISEKDVCDYDGNNTVTTINYDTISGVVLDETVKTEGDAMYKKTSYSGYVNKGGCLLPSSVTTECKHKDSSVPFISTTAYVYDESGNIVRKTESSGTELALTTSFTYDTYGNVISSVSAGTGVVPVTKYNDYDRSGRFVIKTYESPASAVHTFTYDKWGNVQTENDTTEPDNILTTMYQHDNWGDIISAVYADGTITQYNRCWGKSNEYAYFINESTTGQPSKLTWYDNCSREVYVKTDGEMSSKNIIKNTYDSSGNIIKKENKTRKLTITEDFTYDSRGRMLTSVSSSGKSVTYSYGNRSITTECGDYWNIKTFDSWGNVTASSDPESEVTYTYASNGKPERITANGHDVTMTYDATGNRISLSDPDAGTSEYVYSADGKLLKEKDGRNIETSYTFDASGRIVSVMAGNTLTTYTYGTGGYASGRIVSKATGNCSVNYAYDSFGRVISEERNVANKGTYIFRYIYNSNNQLEKVCYPGGLDVKYRYDNNGFRTAVIAGNDTICNVEEYDGLKYTTSFKGKLKHTQTRDERGFISSMQLLCGDDIKEAICFDYDGMTGNLLSRNRNDDAEEYFGYDSLDRLVSVSRGKDEVMTMEYSPDGNIMYKTGIGNYRYNSTYKPHAVTEVDNTEKVISDFTVETEYNDLGKIKNISYTSPYAINNKYLLELDTIISILPELSEKSVMTYGRNVTASAIIENSLYINFIYGPDKDRWYSETTNGITVLQSTIYACNYEKVTKNGVTREFYYLDNNIIIVKQDGTFTPYIAFTDNIGSVLSVSDEDGNKVFEASYDVWGHQTVTLNKIGFHRGYTGHEMMNNVELINMNGRLYDPALGRFLSPDDYVQMPYSSQSFNRYAYCMNNPLKYNDPDGEWFGIDDLLVAGAAFVSGYISNSVFTGHWGISSVKAGVMSAVTSWIGFNTAGLATGCINSSTWSQVSNICINGFISKAFPSITIPLGDKFGISLSPSFGFGENGLTGGITSSLFYSDGDFNISLSGGITNNYAGWNMTASYNGWGGGFGITYYNEEVVKGNTLGKQAVGTITLLARGDVSFRLSNDMFGKKENDRWRTSAAELSIGDFSIGTYVTTNNGKDESDKKTVDLKDPILGHNPYKNNVGGAWKNGEFYSAPFWVGFKSGNQVYRLGYSHRYVQSLTQNAVHKYLVKTPYFLGHDNFYNGVFSYFGYNSPLSLW